MMSAFLKYFAIISFVLSTLAGGVRLGLNAIEAGKQRAAQAQKQKDDNDRLVETVRALEEGIRVLKVIEVSEHPDYSPMLYPKE